MRIQSINFLKIIQNDVRCHGHDEGCLNTEFRAFPCGATRPSSLKSPKMPRKTRFLGVFEVWFCRLFSGDGHEGPDQCLQFTQSSISHSLTLLSSSASSSPSSSVPSSSPTSSNRSILQCSHVCVPSVAPHPLPLLADNLIDVRGCHPYWKAKKPLSFPFSD